MSETGGARTWWIGQGTGRLGQGKRGGDRLEGVRRRRGEETGWIGQGDRGGDKVDGARKGVRRKVTVDPEVEISSYLSF